eukprot:CAMPEP_0117036756 /NCGR_PEP_ID=MMETSP0472-20121206/26005_1 /TAXON_ID=693140 ORGANISM="Tiarina fusus, Strain LIS" /NCGR_SAMPLE_ID=MMETSP0472 /ASSEMBLY_ACC=CAM_ASM_000603 /LENGTH=210 /DNA_ID=CAMNT_0004746581 /DNA_START=139 /DNA_END=771 /DNA_ORIENTATION=-
MAPFSTINEMSMFLTCGGSGNDQASTTSSPCLPPLHEDTDLPKRRGISFSECVEINFVLHRNDFSSEERSQSWYGKDEIKAIKNGVRASVAKLTNFPNMPDDDDYCSRGIENRTREGARRKLQNKVDARAAVFFEQEMQQVEGSFDEEQIADCYYEYSEPCHAAAHMVALRDEQAAKIIYATPSKEATDFLCLGRIESEPAVHQVASSAA